MRIIDRLSVLAALVLAAPIASAHSLGAQGADIMAGIQHLLFGLHHPFALIGAGAWVAWWLVGRNFDR